MIDIDELERLAKAATPGPWHINMAEVHRAGPCPGDDESWSRRHQHLIAGLHNTVGDFNREQDNARFIAAARNAMPELLKRLRAAEEIVRAAEKALDGIDWDEHLLTAEGKPCDPCDMGREGMHEVLDHHSVSVGFGRMLRLRRAVETQR
jgi:hypothetical protein